MKILVTFPFFADAGVALESYRSFQAPDVDIYTIDDNAKADVKVMYSSHQIPIHETNTEDKFATGCWNQAYRYFMEHPEYDCLRIGFSDVIMQRNWKEILEANWDENVAILPNFYEGLNMLTFAEDRPFKGNLEAKDKGTPADCVFLSRKLVELAFPVPENIKLWYNDEYIFTIMRECGYKTAVLDNLRAFHYGSLILTGPFGKESSRQIEDDKYYWKDHVEKEMWEKINAINAR